jgi:hypothetical protein
LVKTITITTTFKKSPKMCGGHMVGLKLNNMSILIPTNITFGLKDLDLM